MGATRKRATGAGQGTAQRQFGAPWGNTAGLPVAHGLYDPALEKDSCGVGFIADIKGRKSHKLIEDALAILCNLEHRGAVGADPRAGDGAGILVQIPRKARRRSGYDPVSLSCRTVVYKGMFLADQLCTYYPDLHDKDFESALALVHQRFSTNTFPTWSLAHPYRMIAHNGEINTLRGNVNWMAARQASVHSQLYGKDINRLWPISYEGQSDTACFDNGLEFLVQGGYSLPHAVMMMIPEAWAGNPLMDEQRRAFYEYHAALMEPWDGPAAIAFTDGRQIGATLDRNGLRPARYLVTSDDSIV